MSTIKMAWRNLWRHPARSGLILASVSIGFTAGLFVLGLYRGMVQSRLRTVIEAEVGHIQLHARGFKPDLTCDKLLPASDRLIDSLKREPSVSLVGKRSIAEAMLISSNGSVGVVVQGVDYPQEFLLSQLSAKLIERSSDLEAYDRSVLVGKKLADKQKLQLGSKLVITVVDLSGSLVSSVFRVKGIFRSANMPFDERNIYVAAPALNGILGISNRFHELVLLLRSDDSTDAIVSRYQRQYPGLQVEGWKNVSPETDLLVSAVDAYSAIVLSLVFLALSFGIINTLLMSVLERTHEFGMMMALGMNRLRVFVLVMCETVLLVFAGIPAGAFGAWGIIRYYQVYGIDFSKRSPDLMRSFGFESVLHPIFPTDRLLSIATIVVLTTLLSGLFPAWRVLRLNPSDAMRN